MLIPSKRTIASFNWTLTLPFKTANTTNWITFCSGGFPDESTADSILSLNDPAIVNNKVATLTSNAGTQWDYSTYTDTPPVYYCKSLPTVRTFQATSSGTITHAAVFSNNFFILVDVGLLNSGAVIQLDKINVNSGDAIELLAIQYKIWG